MPYLEAPCSVPFQDAGTVYVLLCRQKFFGQSSNWTGSLDSFHICQRLRTRNLKSMAVTLEEPHSSRVIGTDSGLPYAVHSSLIIHDSMYIQNNLEYH